MFNLEKEIENLEELKKSLDKVMARQLSINNWLQNNFNELIKDFKKLTKFDIVDGVLLENIFVNTPYKVEKQANSFGNLLSTTLHDKEMDYFDFSLVCLNPKQFKNENSAKNYVDRLVTLWYMKSKFSSNVSINFNSYDFREPNSYRIKHELFKVTFAVYDESPFLFVRKYNRTPKYFNYRSNNYKPSKIKNYLYSINIDDFVRHYEKDFEDHTFYGVVDTKLNIQKYIEDERNGWGSEIVKGNIDDFVEVVYNKMNKK